MVTITRRLAGALPYSAIYFPDVQTVSTVASTLAPMRFARLFFTAENVTGRCIIAHHIATTANSDLTVSAEAMWKALNATGRNNIRRVEKLGDRVSIERNGPNGRRDFLDLLGTLARHKDHVSTISANRLALFGNAADVFVVYLDGKAYGAHLMLSDPEAGRARLLFSAGRRLEEPEMARTSADLNRLLHWREMQFYREQGFQTYDFGGITEEATDGIARFKLSFGGAIVREHVYLCAGLPKLGHLGWKLVAASSSRGRAWRVKAEEQTG